ncbi:MAG: hypothetical protein QM767_13115 [Anaeromyxobacter sp.]
MLLHALLAGWLLTRPPLAPPAPQQAGRWIAVDPPPPPPVEVPAPAPEPAQEQALPPGPPAQPAAPALRSAPVQQAVSAAALLQALPPEAAAQAAPGGEDGPVGEPGDPLSGTLAAAVAAGERWPTMGAGGTGTVAAGRAAIPPVIRLGERGAGPGISDEVVQALAREFKAGKKAALIPSSVRKRVEDTIVLPGVGEVTADKVCLTADGSAYRTTLGSFDETICDEGVWDSVTDYRKPTFRCLRSHTERVDTRVVEAPATYVAHKCVKWDSTKDYRTPPCVKWADVVETQITKYNEESFAMDDPRHERPIRKRKTIPVCP